MHRYYTHTPLPYERIYAIGRHSVYDTEEVKNRREQVCRTSVIIALQ